MSEAVTEQEMESQPKWRPLSAIQRRIVGVLVEKAKTTPDAYPLSLNALTTGCNQKSNRHPQMNLEPDDVEEALDQLREMGAVSEVQGGGRVTRYRHYMKEWLGVDGTELAVMAELLLRGPQTVGELRGRAVRMAAGQIPDLGALRPVLQSLTGRRLVEPLTPEGRGQVVTHSLYSAREMEDLRQKHRGSGDTHPAARSPIETAASAGTPSGAVAQASSSPSVQSPTGQSPAHAAAAATHDENEVHQLREEVSQLRSELAQLRKDLEDVWASMR